MKINEALWNIILASTLNEKQRELWLEFMETVPEDQVASVADVLSQNPELLPNLTENLEVKVAAYSTKDRARWSSAVEQEVTLLGSIDPDRDASGDLRKVPRKPLQ